VAITHNLAGGADANVKLLLLLRLEKARVPIPDVEFRGHHPVGLLQAEFAFEVGLGIVVHVKNNGRLVVADILAEAARKAPCTRESFFARDAKVHRCFRERSEKIVAGEERTRDAQHDPEKQRAFLRTRETLSGHWSLLVKCCYASVCDYRSFECFTLAIRMLRAQVSPRPRVSSPEKNR